MAQTKLYLRYSIDNANSDSNRQCLILLDRSVTHQTIRPSIGSEFHLLKERKNNDDDDDDDEDDDDDNNNDDDDNANDSNDSTLPARAWLPSLKTGPRMKRREQIR